MITIHIGLPKAASTSLQGNLFAKHKDLNYVAAPQHSGHSQLVGDLIRDLKDACLDNDEHSLAETARRLRREITDDMRTTVLSDEAFVRSVSPYVLKDIFPTATILAIVRRPIELYISSYFQSLKGIGKKTNRIIPPKEWYWTFEKRAGNQYQKLNDYISVFGSENVTVAPLEMLKDAPDIFSLLIAKSLRISQDSVLEHLKSPPLNTRFDSHNMWLKRLTTISPQLASTFASPFFSPARKAIRWLLPATPVKHNFPEEVINHILSNTRAACEHLAETKCLPLEELGYFTAQSKRLGRSEDV